MKTTTITRQIDAKTAPLGPSVLRWTAALLWLANVSWKVPPDFGRSADGCRGLCGFVNAGAENPVVPGSAWFFESVVSENLQAFGWMTLLVEALLVVLLVSGRYVRVAALVGIVQSFAIGTAVANASGEWYWSYILMIALHVAILASTPAERPQSARAMAVVAAAYGAVVAVVNAGAGLSGSGDATFFDQGNAFPAEWGQGTFPGSIGAGLLLVALGVGAWFVVGGATASARRGIGWGLVAVSALVLVTFDSDGMIIGLGARPATVAVAAALGLSLAIPGTHRAPQPR
ncbi:hypothetical protein BH20ACT3_BH20ACT3_15310 [soil metagenome]